MITLTLDTALAACTVGIVQGGGILAEAREMRARGHAERLIPMVEEVLRAAHHPRIGRIVTTLGPGSFTGLRVALAAAQAFGLAWDCPVHGVSTLDSVAFAASDSAAGRNILVAHDAGRGQCYGQLFDASARPCASMRTATAKDMVAWAVSADAMLVGAGTDAADTATDPWPAPLAMAGLVDMGRGTTTLTPHYGTSWTVPAP